MDSKKFHAKKVDNFQMRAIGRTVWAGLYQRLSLVMLYFQAFNNFTKVF